MASKGDVIPLSDWRKQTYLKWLLTPPKEREPANYTELARMLDVERKTLYNWKEDRDFLEEWERMYLKSVGDPSRKSEIMNTLFQTATDPDDPKHVQAAKTYFEIEGSLKPTKMEVQVTQRPAKDLSDEELAELISLNAEAEKRNREAS